MKTFLEYINEAKIIESFLDEMANFPNDDTGVGYFMWMGEVGGQHGPRIKVSNTKGKMNKSDCFVMTVAKEPVVITPKSCKLSQRSVDDISDWVKLNYDTLMQMWRVYETGNGSMKTLINKLQSI